MCWGYNQYGQLGDNTTGQKLIPVGVSGLQNAKTISVGLDDNNRSHTCTTLDNGSAMCWGYNLYGQLGDNTTGQKLTPVGVSTGLQNVKTISAGRYHTCAALDNGSAMCWGINNNGQLGDNLPK